MKGDGLIDVAKQQEIARSLGFLTGAELALLAGVQETTLEAWRKRSIGPNYVHFGNQPLYPLDAVREYLSARVRSEKPRALPIAELL
jgi:hypothetical protein